MKQATFVVLGILFAILALIQFTRLYLQLPVIIGGVQMPLLINFVGFAATGSLSLWLFISAKRS